MPNLILLTLVQCHIVSVNETTLRTTLSCQLKLFAILESCETKILVFLNWLDVLFAFAFETFQGLGLLLSEKKATLVLYRSI